MPFAPLPYVDAQRQAFSAIENNALQAITDEQVASFRAMRGLLNDIHTSVLLRGPKDPELSDEIVCSAMRDFITLAIACIMNTPQVPSTPHLDALQKILIQKS